MPNVINRTVFNNHAPTTVDALDREIVQATPGSERFAGLLLCLPFGKRGSATLRAEAKQRGARWDGSDWTLPPERYVRPACDADIQWFLSQNAVTGVLSRQYTPWVWDGDLSKALLLDVPFPARVEAKSLGAVWNPRSNRWVIPIGRLTDALVATLNQREWIAGYESQVQAAQAGRGAVNVVNHNKTVSAAGTATTPAWNGHPTRPLMGTPDRGPAAMARIRLAEKSAELSRFAGAGGIAWGAEQSAHRDALRRLRTHSGVYWLTGTDTHYGRVLVMFADLTPADRRGDMMVALITERNDHGQIQVDLRHPDAAEWTPADWAEHLAYSTVQMPAADAAALYELMANTDGLRPLTVARDANGRADHRHLAALAC